MGLSHVFIPAQKCFLARDFNKFIIKIVFISRQITDRNKPHHFFLDIQESYFKASKKLKKKRVYMFRNV